MKIVSEAYGTIDHKQRNVWPGRQDCTTVKDLYACGGLRPAQSDKQGYKMTELTGGRG